MEKDDEKKSEAAKQINVICVYIKLFNFPDET